MKCEPIAVSEPGRRVGCASCPPSTNQKNLRKYLSKSREALFEKVITRSQEQQKNEQSLRKATLLSQYNKTRRLCESQMSLVSKSRERLLLSEKQSMMTPTFNRSREKLYGLRSLSKSHEMLNLCKTVGGLSSDLDIPETSPLGGILKNLTRVKDTDLSTTSKRKTSDSNQTDLSTLNNKTTKSDIGKNHSKANEPDELLKSADNDKEIKPKLDISSLPECQPLQTVLTFLCNQSNICEPRCSVQDVEDNKENINTGNSTDSDTKSETTLEVESKSDDTLLTPILENKEKKSFIRPPPLLTKQLSMISSEGDPQSPAISHTDSLSLTDVNSSSGSDISDEDGGSMERITGEFSTEEDEPRYTVKQLVSAYNLHQEIVTKCSLEVTMNADSIETKIPPVIETAPNHKFPTGPNALRLFIPGIDIESRSKRSSKKKAFKVSSFKSDTQEENENIEEIEKEETNIEDTVESERKIKNIKEVNETECNASCIDAQSTNKEETNEECSKDIKSKNNEEDKIETDKKTDNKEKQRILEESNRVYLRSSSISSEASCKSSGASSAVTTSLEELPTTDKKPRSNRSSGIASNDGDSAAESWSNRTTVAPTNVSKTIEKFNNGTPRPNRKSFCSPRAPVITTEKTRRKSNPIMKPFY